MGNAKIWCERNRFECHMKKSPYIRTVVSRARFRFSADIRPACSRMRSADRRFAASAPYRRGVANADWLAFYVGEKVVEHQVEHNFIAVAFDDAVMPLGIPVLHHYGC